MKKWQQEELYCLDFTYDIVKKEYGTPELAIYGGIFDKFFINRYFYRYNFFVVDGHLVYSVGGRIFEIPLDNLRKLKIRKSKMSSGYNIKFKSDKRYHYHILIYNADWIFTEKTGNSKDNCEKLLNFLKSKEN